MNNILGWTCTSMVLLGFCFNAKKYYTYAILMWIIGDIGWIIYDYQINNFSHAWLSSCIIIINLYGLYNLRKKIISKKIINQYKDLFI